MRGENGVDKQVGGATKDIPGLQGLKKGGLGTEGNFGTVGQRDFKVRI